MRPFPKKKARKDAEPSLQLQILESRFAQCEQVGHTGSWQWTIADNSKWWSDEMYRIFGYEPKSFTPTFESFQQVLHPADVEPLLARIKKLFDDREPQEFEHRIIRPDGQERILRARCHPVTDAEGTIVRLVGITQDVTDRRSAEETLERSQRRLRTIIDAEPACVKLVSCGGLLLDMNPAGLKMIGADSLSQVAGHRIVDLVHPEDRTKFREAHDLNLVIADLDPMLRRTIGEDILVTVEAAPSLRPISGDATQLQQIIMNLAVNARDAMPEGGALTIRTANVDLDPSSANQAGLAEGRYVSMTVADTGIGMNAETKAHMFEPFFTTKERGQGTGLGLAVVYGIVQNLGGAIVVETDLRHGTIFTVLLPESEVREQAKEAAPEPRVVDLAGHETVLVVEDDNRLREDAARVLRKGGYEVLEASNPAQALELSKQEADRLDALVTDIVMPGIDGFELAERLLSENSGLGVLYMSGYPNESMRRRGLRIDQRRLLEKPFSAAHLLRRVREVLDARH